MAEVQASLRELERRQIAEAEKRKIEAGEQKNSGRRVGGR